MGFEALADDERFRCNSARVENRADLIPLLGKKILERTTADWLATFAEAGVPAGPINSIADIFSEPYADERKLVKSLTHATAGKIPTVANPVRFSSTPVEYRRAPPILGEHTTDILAGELGMSNDEIQRLSAAGAI
jgi:crotonobetainyl-CoA:carnitine CoA-transferase CaiB-like acyl-CoA transferase